MLGIRRVPWTGTSISKGRITGGGDIVEGGEGRRRGREAQRSSEGSYGINFLFGWWSRRKGEGGSIRPLSIGPSRPRIRHRDRVA